MSKSPEPARLVEAETASEEEVLGSGHSEFATVLHNRAMLYMRQGLYRRAEPLLERALALREKVLGPRHPDVAQSLNSLASLYKVQGQYARAEPLYERALAIREETLGPHHPDVARTLSRLAELLAEQGQYDRAQRLCERALVVLEKALGLRHTDVAAVLSQLSVLFQQLGQYERAEPLQERALAILEEKLGPRHPDVAQALNRLAVLYQQLGKYSQAEPLFERALSILEEALGPLHPDVAATLNDLAQLYQARGQYDRADALLTRALRIREEALGSGHPEVAQSLYNMALLCLAQDQLPKVLPLLERMLDLREVHLRTQVVALSNQRLADFLKQLYKEEELVYALLRAHPEEPRVHRLALATTLLRKSRFAEEVAESSRAVHQGLSLEEREAFEHLRVLRSELVSLSLSRAEKLIPEEYQRRLKELMEQGDALETLLARRSAPLRALKAVPLPEQLVERVAGALPEDGVLVEFIAYQDKPLVPKPGVPASTMPSKRRYLALLLFAAGRTSAVDLGPAAPLEQAIQRMRTAFGHKAADWQPAAEAVYQLAFRPLLPSLGTARRLFLVPDGQITVVPFDALYDGKRLLIDTFEFTYLTSGKDLLDRSEGPPPSNSVMVFADPELGTRRIATASQDASIEHSAAEVQASSPCQEMARLNWGPIPYARKEAEAIQRLLPQARLMLGGEATRQALLQVKAPGILHLAVHGFRDEGVSAPEGSRGLSSSGASATVPCPADPLLRAGLVLAGARAPEMEGGAPRLEPSVVTTMELAGLDLWGTQLAVLSMCNTGRGDIERSQGAFELWQALWVAGAETVVMSLWAVSDEATSQLMETYYQHLAAGRGRAEALRLTMKALRGKYPHPHDWAPFISVGQHGPLRGLVPAAPAP